MNDNDNDNNVFPIYMVFFLDPRPNKKGSKQK